MIPVSLDSLGLPPKPLPPCAIEAKRVLDQNLGRLNVRVGDPKVSIELWNGLNTLVNRKLINKHNYGGVTYFEEPRELESERTTVAGFTLPPAEQTSLAYRARLNRERTVALQEGLDELIDHLNLRIEETDENDPEGLIHGLNGTTYTKELPKLARALRIREAEKARGLR